MRPKVFDLGQTSVARLFGIYFFPTLVGMLSTCVVTATDGIFVGHGVGANGLAAVNICYAPGMIIMGIGMMLGMGVSVTAAFQLSHDNIEKARANVFSALFISTLITVVLAVMVLSNLNLAVVFLGSSETLSSQVKDYLQWFAPGLMFQLWTIIGLFVIRLDGSPAYAMWCNVVPGVLNITLDYIFIFHLDMGVSGAAFATFISFMTGGVMVIVYLFRFADKLRIANVHLFRLRETAAYCYAQCKVGLSVLLGEGALGIMTYMGNLMFMKYAGDAGVGAFSVACYFAPFVFMTGNAVAQSAQPIISYNFGIGALKRVVQTERIAVGAAIICGLLITSVFVMFPRIMVSLFIDAKSAAGVIATRGLPIFAMAFVAFVFNLTVIGYFQSVGKVRLSVIFALLRGIVFIIPAYLILPSVWGINGVWLAQFVSEVLTSLTIVAFYCWNRIRAF